MLIVFAASILLAQAAAGSLRPPPFCSAPATAIETVICRDPELVAWAKSSLKLYDDLYRHSPDEALDLWNDSGWPKQLDACADAACARQAYADWVGDWLLSPEHDYPIRGGQHFERPRSHGSRGDLDILELGGGWAVFRLDAGYPPGGAGSWISGHAGGLIKLAGERGVYREASGAGLDFTRRGRDWQIAQVGDCDCGPDLSLSGVYRRR